MSLAIGAEDLEFGYFINIYIFAFYIYFFNIYIIFFLLFAKKLYILFTIFILYIELFANYIIYIY